ncbi:S1C family serine protease [Treponema zioleckii]|uniref:S1C family serine protease n=1 Tax=Treponema zioleckii TaxID=331680 RepID=UPI00168A911B|nr:serine protease [Treponema zioleckii]
MKKFKLKTLFAAAFLFSAASVFSQVKDYVCVVRQKYFPEHIKCFEGYRDEFKANGSSTYASYIDAYLKGGFGSGFVFVAPDGTNYIITNRHVVSQAASASAEFENSENGEVTKYDNLKVLLTDDEIDIAILGFEDGKRPFKKGLTISSSTLSDGDDVLSAGFPGLGNEPVWQLGKGSVTNARARLKELLDPSISTIIQHSAQIDSGNSGGPLMKVSSKGVAGYEVVGINTWKATSRDSTNFAIPAAVITQMISKVQSAKNTSAEEALGERSKKLASVFMDLGSDFTAVAKYVSYERASTRGSKDFESVLHFAPSKVRSLVLEAFSFDPAEGFRYASAYQIWKKYSASQHDGVKYTAGNVKIQDGKATADFTSDGEEPTTVTTTWIKEHGLWRLLELSSDEKQSDSKNSKNSKTSAKSDDKKESGSSYFGSPEVDFYETVVFTGGIDLSLNGNDVAFGGGMEVFLEDSTFGFCFMFNHEQVDYFGEKKGLNVFGPGVILKIPVKMGNFGLTPYGKLNLGLGFGLKDSLAGYTAEAGLRAMFNTDNLAHYGIGIAYKKLHLSEFMSTDDDFYDSQKFDLFENQGISIYAIFSF